MRRALSILLGALVLAAAVQASIPSADKIAGAIAEAYDLAGRAKPLLLVVELRISGGGERHLLLGDQYQASRDGELLASPHPFLPPVFLLQATSGAALAAALSSFGVAGQEVVLGRLEDYDCYVFGGRRYPGPMETEALLPSLWIEMESFEPVRIVRSDGTEYRLGPIEVFDGIRLPSWIEIQTPSLRARLDILNASRADAPAAAFVSDWLRSAPPAE